MGKPLRKPDPRGIEEVREREPGGLETVDDGQQQDTLAVSSTDFVKVEKNVISLGFFSPSSSRSGQAKPKVITFTRVENGRRFKESVIITPGYIEDESGKPRPVLPNTADQDKYLAFHKLLMERRRRHGTITNPIEFTSAELLRLLGINHSSGKNFKEVAEWLDVMSSATVMSKLVWHAGEKRWAKGKDRYHVFARAVSIGEQFEPGKTAEANLVWLDPWQLENLIQNFTLPIDFETYRRLKNHIAKALVPLLQIWLYATREKGSFEKRYDELCQILSLTEYSAVSRIAQQLKRSLDELQMHGYLSRWAIQDAGEPRSYKIVFWHGEKFHRDRNRFAHGTVAALPPTQEEDSSAQVGGEEVPAQPDGPPPLVAEMVERGIAEKRARQILSRLPTGQEVLDQLEWGDFLVAEAKQGRGQPLRNPPGLYVHLLTNNITPPDTFTTSRRRRLFEESKEARQREEAEKERRREAYYQYRAQAISKHIEAAYTPEEYARLLQKEEEEACKEDPRRFQDWKPTTLKTYVVSRFRASIERQLPFMSLDEFCQELDRAPLLPFSQE